MLQRPQMSSSIPRGQSMEICWQCSVYWWSVNVVRVGACQLTINNVPGMLAAKKALTQQGWTSVFGFPKKRRPNNYSKKNTDRGFRSKNVLWRLRRRFLVWLYSCSKYIHFIRQKIENIPHCKNAGCLLILVWFYVIRWYRGQPQKNSFCFLFCGQKFQGFFCV